MEKKTIRSTHETVEKRSLPRRRRRRLYAAIGLSAMVLLVLLVLVPLAYGPAESATNLPHSVTSPLEPSTTTTTYPSVPVNTPIYSGGVLLPSSLPDSPVRVKVPILVYHAVASLPIRGPAGKELTLPTPSFEAEMSYMLDHGYTPVTLEQIYLAMARKTKLPAKPVALTFDDGYGCIYNVVLPILEAHHIRATFFIISGNVGKLGFVTWDELRVMKAAGMAIESHTVHHKNLVTLSDAVLASELSQSRAAITAELGQVPAALSYPEGEWDKRVVAATRAAGYLIAVIGNSSSAPVLRNTYAWPRIGIDRYETLSNFAKALEGIVPAKAGSILHKRGPVIPLRPWARVWQDRPPKQSSTGRQRPATY
jgi:peptidoglycan/xylan/chitin deacetylase (PgdA/CDA1 family)